MLRICSIPGCLVAEKMEEIDTFSAIDKDGETIVSAGGSFQLGFFSPRNSTRRYLGIWYQKISPGTVVWVANREIPLFDSLGVLKVTNQGILVLNCNDTIIWSSNSSILPLNPVAKLLDSGNLVMLEENDDMNPENFLWQSFDYPGNMLLSGMKLGRNTATGLEWYVSSWKSTDDPSRGDFTTLIDPKGFPQLVIRKGLVVQDRAGSWNGVRFSGTPNLTPNSIYKYHFVFNQREMFCTYENVNSSVVTRVVLNLNGIMQCFIWIDRTQGWNPLRTAQTEFCSGYALCGVYGSCNTGYTPECGCLKGFVPKFPKQ